jgi:uncharacterized protein YqeY
VTVAAELIVRIESDTKDAMKARDKLRVGALRRARAAIKNAEIEQRGDLDDDQVVAVLRKLVKQHDESIEQFRAGDREDLVDKEAAEKEVIVAYLPAELDAEAIEGVVREVVAEVGASGPKDMGAVMKGSMGRLKGRADGRAVKDVVQRVLGEVSGG